MHTDTWLIQPDGPARLARTDRALARRTHHYLLATCTAPMATAAIFLSFFLLWPVAIACCTLLAVVVFGFLYTRHFTQTCATIAYASTPAIDVQRVEEVLTAIAQEHNIPPGPAVVAYGGRQGRWHIDLWVQINATPLALTREQGAALILAATGGAGSWGLPTQTGRTQPIIIPALSAHARIALTQRLHARAHPSVAAPVAPPVPSRS